MMSGFITVLKNLTIVRSARSERYFAPGLCHRHRAYIRGASQGAGWIAGEESAATTGRIFAGLVVILKCVPSLLTLAHRIIAIRLLVHELGETFEVDIVPCQRVPCRRMRVVQRTPVYMGTLLKSLFWGGGCAARVRFHPAERAARVCAQSGSDQPRDQQCRQQASA